jgi:hypothetical protein
LFVRTARKKKRGKLGEREGGELFEKNGAISSILGGRLQTAVIPKPRAWEASVAGVYVPRERGSMYVVNKEVSSIVL